MSENDRNPRGPCRSYEAWWTAFGRPCCGSAVDQVPVVGGTRGAWVRVVPSGMGAGTGYTTTGTGPGYTTTGTGPSTTLLGPVPLY